MTSKEAFNELKENAKEICEWELDRLNIIEKDLEVLEILKNKLVDITILYFSTCIEVYNCSFANRPKFKLTQEEYNKIKDWLGND